MQNVIALNYMKVLSEIEDMIILINFLEKMLRILDLTKLSKIIFTNGSDF